MAAESAVIVESPSSAPASAVSLSARRGTAYYSRLLRGLSDDALREPSAVDGFDRAQVVASVALDARGLAVAMDALTRDEPAETAPEWELPWAELVTYTATLPAGALRNLHDHTVVHLNVAARDLARDAWSTPLEVWGSRASAQEYLRRRERQIWVASLCLRAGGVLSDLPDPSWAAAPLRMPTLIRAR
ncbi:maleylpyruvate isomerase N-terminal domain-containing protein [Herbiconiux sp. 11R-BC]|uniref:maleylpyruvate isomerase N-terminal domain-containing protein n=1 Tax=Herbiconiux sp. 11R-BC TaxID=3111637 RepID=UPI003C032F97